LKSGARRYGADRHAGQELHQLAARRGAGCRLGVRDALAARFGKASIFMDGDNLLAGQRFGEELAKVLASCDVFLAIIDERR
jgi:hypothetical protein